MKQEIKLGAVCLARKTFDYIAAKEIWGKKRLELESVENVNWIFEEELIIEVEDAQKAAKRLASEGIDGIVVISGTFHLGHLTLIFDKVVDKPVLLWPFDELPYDGGKIRLNSVCGLNLNASNLYKSGNDTYSYCLGDTIDEDWINAIRIKVAIENAHMGLIGYRAHGFFNLDVEDLQTFKKFGVLVDQFPISALWSEEVSESELNEQIKEVKKIFDVSTVTAEQVRKVAQLAVSAKKFMDKNKLSGIGIRCWPEFAQDYGISPCAAMSVLQSKGYLMGCEGDLEGTLTMVACKAIGAETPYFADLSQVNTNDDYALMWHCGVAPCNLWDGKCNRSLDTYFASGRGVTADFVLKPGKVNVFRLDSARGKTRIYMAEGEALPMEKDLKGTYAKVRFKKHITDVLDQIIHTGIAHHVILVYGEFRRPFEIYARLMDLEIIK